MLSFNPEPTAKEERANAPVSAGPVGTRIGALAPDTFAVGSGLNDSVWPARGLTGCQSHGSNEQARRLWDVGLVVSLLDPQARQATRLSGTTECPVKRLR